MGNGALYIVHYALVPGHTAHGPLLHGARPLRHNVRCTLQGDYSMLCTPLSLHGAHCTLRSAQAVDFDHCTLQYYSTFPTAHAVPCALHTLRTAHQAHCAFMACSAHCAQHIAYSAHRMLRATPTMCMCAFTQDLSDHARHAST